MTAKVAPADYEKKLEALADLDRGNVNSDTITKWVIRNLFEADPVR